MVNKSLVIIFIREELVLLLNSLYHTLEVTKYQLNGKILSIALSVLRCSTVLLIVKQCLNNVMLRLYKTTGVTTVNNEVITSKDYPYNTNLVSTLFR